jgi:ArsR family transcriptional regulator, arsenate/arsenite/antimonite-responsive transcriptional repressor
MENKTAVTTLSSLAQESRLTIFRTLVQAGPDGMAAGKISKTTGIPPSSLSFHLKEMSNSGIVSSRQESRYIYYSANFKVMNELLAFLTENCCAGVACGVETPCCEEDA